LEQVELPAAHIIPFDQRLNIRPLFIRWCIWQHCRDCSGCGETFSQEVRERKRIFSHANTDLARHDPQVLQVIGKASCTGLC
jgi:hypothetical protein